MTPRAWGTGTAIFEAPVPDVIFYRREQLRGCRAPGDFTEPPDLALAIGIVSPGQKLAEQSAEIVADERREDDGDQAEVAAPERSAG